jgi:hemerythrin-like domain-containing protein
MQAVDILPSKHRLIERSFAILDVMATRVARGECIPPNILWSLLEFFKTLADQCHHHKEEQLLFPKLNELGTPFQNGPIEAMIHEQVQGREFISKRSDVLNAWDDHTVHGQFVQIDRGCIDPFRHHNQKED